MADKAIDDETNVLSAPIAGTVKLPAVVPGSPDDDAVVTVAGVAATVLASSALTGTTTYDRLVSSASTALADTVTTTIDWTATKDNITMTFTADRALTVTNAPTTKAKKEIAMSALSGGPHTITSWTGATISPVGDSIVIPASGSLVVTLEVLAGTVYVYARGSIADIYGLQAALDGKKSQGKETQWVPAAAMKPATTSGAATGTYESTTNKVNIEVLDFDGAADEYAWFTIAMPKSWNEGTVTFQAFWFSTATDTDSCIWGLAGVAISDNETLDVALGTAQTVTDNAQSAANEIYVSAESSAITIGGSPAEGDLVAFRIFRDSDTDSMTEDARLVGIKLFFTTNAANDA